MSQDEHRSTSPFILFTALNTLVAIGLMVLFTWKLQWDWFLSFLITINSLTFVNYAYDKVAAMVGLFRIPEKELHLLAFLGGTPAAILAHCQNDGCLEARG